jgi:hypothetical protein
MGDAAFDRLHQNRAGGVKNITINHGCGGGDCGSCGNSDGNSDGYGGGDGNGKGIGDDDNNGGDDGGGGARTMAS